MEELRPIFGGNDKYAYRDPACVYADGIYYLFFTLSEKENGYMYNYIAMSQSRDLTVWSNICKITPKDRTLNFSSPGSILKVGEEYVISICSYPLTIPYKESYYADDSARIFTIRTRDFESFTQPQLIMARGNMPVEEMGRTIDSFIFEDKDTLGLYHLLFKQDGKIGLSHSANLNDWEFDTFIEGGENPCIITEDDYYYLIYSPNDDGIGFKRSLDLKKWEDLGTTVLDKDKWDFASGRITAGFAMKAPEKLSYRYILFFHGSIEETFPETHGNASLAFVLTDDFEKFKIHNKG